MQSHDEDIYARWLSGSLSAGELRKLQESGELAVLERIVAEADSWEVPAAKSAYADLRKKLSGKKQPGARVFPLFRRLAIAAGLALLALLGGLYYYNVNSMVTIQTLAGETKTIMLPDSSVAVMGGNSELSYRARDWENKRALSMKGKVYFDVKKKGGFEVSFGNGSVAVMGTAFEVIATARFSQVKCFRGKVLATIRDSALVLEAGMGRNSDMQVFTFSETSAPAAAAAYTRFENASLNEVLAALDLQFGYTFKETAPLSDRRFTGQFSNANGAAALRVVFGALSVNYEVSGKQVLLK